jgi:hypothetical protein
MGSITALEALMPAGAKPVCTPGDPENNIKPDPRGEMTYVKSNGTLGQLQTMESSNKSKAEIARDAAKIERQLLCERNPIACSGDRIPFEKFQGDITFDAGAGPFSVHGKSSPGSETWSTNVGKPERPYADLGIQRKLKDDPLKKLEDKTGLHIKPIKKKWGPFYIEYKPGQLRGGMRISL